MNKSASFFLIGIAIIAVIMMVIGAFYFLQHKNEQKESDKVRLNTELQVEEGTNTPTTSPQNPPVEESAPGKNALTIEADDAGFYTGGNKISSIQVVKNEEVEITFVVRKTNVYYGGLDFSGNGIKKNAKPGGSTLFSFTAEKDFSISSYWPSSGVLKDTLDVRVK